MSFYSPTWECYSYFVRSLGYDKTDSIQHTETRRVTLCVNGVEKMVLQERERTHNSTAHVAHKLVGAWEDGTFGSVNGTSDDIFAGSIADDATFVDRVLRFIDPVNDIFVYTDRIDTCHLAGTADTGSGDLLEQTGDTGWATTAMPFSILVRATNDSAQDTSLQVDGKKGYTLDPTHGTGHDPYLILLGGTGGIQYKTLGGELIYNDSTADGGDYYFYPEWIRSMGGNKTMDEANRDIQVALTAGTTSEPVPVFTDATPFGSFAAKGEVHFYSCAGLNTIINEDMSESDPVALSGLTGTNPVLYPVAPV